MSDPVSISEARRKLFDLFAAVTSKRRRVTITHRDSEQAAVLIDRRELAALEEAARGQHEAFSIWGSGELHADPEVALAEMRSEQADLADAKQRGR